MRFSSKTDNKWKELFEMGKQQAKLRGITEGSFSNRLEKSTNNSGLNWKDLLMKNINSLSKYTYTWSKNRQLEEL